MGVEVLMEKKSKNKNEILETHENVENFEPSEIKESKSKKRRKEKCVADEMVDSLVCDIQHKKSKKSKKDRLNDSDADSMKTDEDKGVKRSKEESVVDFSDSLQCDRHPKKKKKKKLKGGSD